MFLFILCLVETSSKLKILDKGATCIILKTIFIIYIFITALHNTLPESVTNEYKKKCKIHRIKNKLKIKCDK